MRTLLFMLLLHWKHTSADDCVGPSSLRNGQIKGHGGGRSWSGRFTCDGGFYLVGPRVVKCSNGLWSSPTFPVCTAAGSCDPSDLPAIAHGRYDEHNTKVYRGSVYKYSCDPGYVMYGHHLVHCDGQGWDLSRLPLCHSTHCSTDNMLTMEAGQVLRRGHGNGVLMYRCTAPDSVLIGSSTLVCTDKGWNSSAPHCSYGPSSVTMSGPETTHPGDQVTLTCVAGGHSLPGPRITWSVTAHDGRRLDHLVKTSQIRTVSGEAGYTSETVAQVSVPRHDHILGLNVQCHVTNEETGAELTKKMTLAVQFAPRDLSMTGPSTAQPGDQLTVHCHTSASVPPAQVSWVASPSVSNMVTTETVHQQEDGSFITMSSISVDVPDRGDSGEHGEHDIVLQCVAAHVTAPDASIASVHVVKIKQDLDLTSTTSTTTTEEQSLDDYYDEDEYYFESNEIDQQLYPSIEKFDIPFGDVDDVTEEIFDDDATGDMKHSAVDYNKYQVDNRELLREDVTNYLDAELSSADDNLQSSQDPAVGETKTRNNNNIDSELFTHSESAAYDKSFNSRKNDPAVALSVTEANKKRDTSETEGSVPAKAWIAANNGGADVKISLVTLMTIWSSLICLKYFQS